MAQLFALYAALKNQVKKDETEERRQIFLPLSLQFSLDPSLFQLRGSIRTRHCKILFGIGQSLVDQLAAF